MELSNLLHIKQPMLPPNALLQNDVAVYKAVQHPGEHLWNSG